MDAADANHRKQTRDGSPFVLLVTAASGSLADSVNLCADFLGVALGLSASWDVALGLRLTTIILFHHRSLKNILPLFLQS